MDNRPIGIFDSGLGGLTVVKQFKKIFPKENIVYLGDTLRFPYGTRSKEIIIRFSLEDAGFLVGKGVKCIVIACNTASSVSLNILRKKFEIPIFGVIKPASLDAVAKTKNKKIGVIGTKATIDSAAYKKAILKIDNKIMVFQNEASLLVSLVENGELKGKTLKLTLEKYLKPLLKKNIDTLVLGCTHFPIIKQSIKKVIGDNINLVDPAEMVVKEAFSYIKRNNLQAGDKIKHCNLYYVTDITKGFEKTGEMFLGERLGETLKKVSLI